LIIHDRIHVLIPKEYRSTRCCLSILGGKADYDSETPQKTAAREFSEETAKIVSQEDATTLVQGGTKVYIPEGKYTLFIFLMSRDKHADIPPKYAKKYFKSFDAEAASLHWIPFENVIQALDKGLDSIALSLREDGPKEPYDDFLPKVFRNTEVLKCIDEIVRVSLRSGIEAEIDRIEKLYQSPQPEQEFNSKILGRQWRLCLEAPPQPPPSPIQTLNPKSEEYVKTLAGLPDQIKQRVVRVRMVNVTTRTAVYNNAFRANRGTPTEPLFHGTPDQWRATAIAMHGFDLKHRLHGRALGDGIYTAADPAVSVGYAKSNGSIIQLRGNITVMGNDKTISQGTNVHVFPNPAHVLPLFILDMDSVVDKHVDNDMQYEEAEEQRKKTLAEMNKKEEAMLKDAFQRWTASAKFYLNQLLAISSRLTTESLYGSSDLQLANWRAYMREKRQFEQRLPIYSSKATIIEKVQNNQITILISSTGSGKSTQLPQYIRDDVIPSSDPRSVAVLQPRRINAVALSSRVSHERDSWVGGETGYSLGGGKACTSRQTRIEFMTHGLFLQKCAASSKNDFESIVSNYAAIIVDEAHERSVEIDLILGLLALLVGRNKDASSTPKIIICSATISFVANQLCDYFKAGGAMTVAKLELPGFSFPVHVQHRSDLNPDPKEIGTAGFSRVMCSYAVQTAIDMVRQTPSGNILVFLPGAGDIRTALMAFKATINDGSSLDSSMRSRHLRRGSDDHNVDTPNVSDSDGDDDGSGGVDYSDSHHNDLHFTCKFAVTSKPKSAMKTLGVFGVHGRVSAELQHAILEPTEDRIIVFTTNVAETGLTIPEIRYVVDTGLERRVRWNQEANLSEMETVQITKSSMHQRTGRAGRVSSGICVRLYSEETAEKFIEAPQPAIQSGEVLKTVLRLRSLESPPKLLVEIPDEVEEKCIEILQSFGALDKDGEVSNTGRILLKLGLDLRLGMFLLACQKLGCLGAGSYIAAVCSVEAQEYFLPGRDDPKSPLLKYVSSMGDHLTILCAYDAISRMDPEPRRRFCNKTKIPLSVLDEIGAAHVAIVAGLTGVQFNVVDELGSKNELWRAINTAVAVGYFDHLVAARSPGSPSQQFVWILDSRLQSDVEAVVSTFKYQHAPPPIPSVNNAGANIPPVESAPRRLTSHGATSSGDSSSDASESPSCKEDLTVTLGSRSALWHIGKSKSNTLAIFSSVLLTDGSNYVPSVKTMSYVTEECLDKAMGILKLDIDLSRLARANTRLVTKFDIKTVDHAYLVKKNPQFLKDLRRQFPQLVIAVADSKDHLIVSAPKHIATFAIESIKRRLANIHPELIKLKVR
jgi:HrpA-like RNA helicase/8-oxo-dGTP pyrophosphatase MutT (NUDIX family)